VRTVILGAVLVSVVFARTAAAVCTAADVMQCGVSCWGCSGNTCTIGKLLTVTPPAGGSCLFDFGSRDIVLAGGGFTTGQNAFEIRAHGLTIGGSGTLKATGNQVTPGGVITLTLGGGGFTLFKSANPIDVTGAEGAGPVFAGGGSLTIQSDGSVALNGTILADGTTTNANGGTVMVTAGRLSGTTVISSGNVTVTNVLSAGSGANGIGGTFSFTANGTSGTGKIDIENKIIALGGLGGGTISLNATGDVVLGVNPNGGPLLIADANGNAGCGGTIDVLAGGNIGGQNGVTSPLVARGSAAALASDGGGGGGMISLETLNGSVNLGGGSLGGIAADGGINGCGGGVCINTDTPGAGITTAVPISANASGPTSLGGCVQLCSSGAALVHDDIDASGGCGGDAEVDTLLDLTVEPPTRAVHADASTGSGGCVTLSAGGGVAVSSLLNAATTATAPGNAGGEVDVLSNGAGMVNALVNASGSASNLGGVVDIEAGSDLTIGSTATLNADGGAAGGDGGTLILVAGSPDLLGTLALNGQAHAKGTSSGLASAQARLMGCTVAIGATGSLDTSGDTQAANFIVARNTLSIAAGATISTTGGDPTSRNFVTLPVGSPMPGGPAFSPPLAPTDVTFAPPCTAFNTPPNCLARCPVCGNGVVEYPETCDAGAANGPCKPCGPTCRIIDCNDNNPCTTDSCDPILGCSNTFIPGCTTTTTTLEPPSTTTSTTSPTSSTTASTATTTTVAPTTTTATSTITTSTVTSTTTASTTTNTLGTTTSTSTSTSTTSTVTSTTTVSTSPEASTTTTTLPCTTARCILDAARADAACAGQSIPASVVTKLGKAETLLDEVGTSPARKARKLRTTAKRVLRVAERVTTHLAREKKLSAECAAVLKSAADRVVASL